MVPCVASHIKGGETSTEVETTALEWPIGVYSLSHIALPFPPYDEVYGELMKGGRAGAVIGDMIARGEPGLLSLVPSYFLRLRNNPFYAYQVQVLNRWLDDTG